MSRTHCSMIGRLCRAAGKICFLVLGIFSTNACAEDEKPAAQSVQITSWENVQNWSKSQQQIVVLNVWTTTCGKCLEEFPGYLKLSQNFQKQPVTFGTINCDYDGIEGKPPKLYQPDVETFLRKHKSNLTHFLLSISFLDFLEKINLSSTPAILIYGRDGKLLKRFDHDDVTDPDQEYTLKEVEQFLQKTLAQTKP